MRNITESDSNVILLSPGLFPEIVEEIKEKVWQAWYSSRFLRVERQHLGKGLHAHPVE